MNLYVKLFAGIMDLEKDSAMTYHGKVKNGVVVLDSRAHLPDGADVLVLVESPAGLDWMKCVGTISDDDARGMLAAIEDVCE